VIFWTGRLDVLNLGDCAFDSMTRNSFVLAGGSFVVVFCLSVAASFEEGIDLYLGKCFASKRQLVFASKLLHYITTIGTTISLYGL